VGNNYTKRMIERVMREHGIPPAEPTLKTGEDIRRFRERMQERMPRTPGLRTRPDRRVRELEQEVVALKQEIAELRVELGKR
jgi:hypothetical protein